LRDRRNVNTAPTDLKTDERRATRVREGEEWISALRSSGAERDTAMTRLHELLVRAAWHELSRRGGELSHVRGEELEDIAMQAADDAMVAVLAKLDSFRGGSRFVTWAYKFALLEAGVRLRRRAWQGREVLLAPAVWPLFADERSSAQDELEQAAVIDAVRDAVADALTPHQRDVFVALALNGVPIDVLAERLATTRGALYKVLHDARHKLRDELATARLARG
jgi:RNA polymerase sigma-70 factor, ECF subfamily